MDNEAEYSTASEVDSLNHESKKEPKKDITKLPKSAVALYIKLYCSRKDTKSLKHTSKMIEATKSWITLSEFEKQKFYNKYQEYQQKYSDVFISRLQKSEPFMKKKTLRSQKKNISDNKMSSLDEDDNKVTTVENVKTEINVLNGNHESLKTENIVEEINIFDSNNQIRREEVDNLCIEENNALEDASKISYPEPIAPSLKSGRELFEVIKSNMENDLSWSTLPQREKNLYNQASLTMKRDYIHKYRIYLEALTQRQLFDHYNKCFKY